jgi:L-amino acid N-acyltransferase YncA
MNLDTFTPDSTGYPEFLRFAEDLYEGDPYWTHPADPLPGLVPVCFLVNDDERTLARACLTRIPGEDALRLGWYECVDDDAAASALLEGVRAYARSLGIATIIGPINGSTWQRYRFADSTDTKPFFLDVHNKPWYMRQWSKAGAIEIASYYSTRIERLGEYTGYDDRLLRQLARGVSLREFRLDRAEEDLRIIYAISTAAFAGNLFYTPIDTEEFLALYRPILPLVRPQLVRIAEDAEDRAVGFVFAVDNVLERTRRSLVMKSAAVLPEHAGRGLGHLLLESVHRAAAEQGYDEIIHALIHRDNRSGSILAERAQPYRTYRLFSLPT